GDGSALPCALDAESMERAGGRGVVDLDVGHIQRGRQEVLGERHGFRLSIGVELELLEQYAADSLRHPSSNLIFDHPGMDGPAAFVDDDVVDDPRPSYVGVDLDDGGVGTGHPRDGVRLESLDDIRKWQGGEHPTSKVCLGEVDPRDLAIPRCVSEFPVDECDVFGSAVQQSCGTTPNLLRQLLGGPVHGGAGHRSRSTGESADPVRCQIRVTAHDAYIDEIDRKDLSDDLGEGRLVALPGAGRSRMDPYPAV